MAGVAAALGWLALALLAVVILVLFTRFHIRLTLQSRETAEVALELRLFSSRLPRLLRITTRLGGRDGAVSAPVARGRREKRRRPRKTRKAGAMARRLGRHLREIPGVIGDTLSGVHIERLALHARIGLPDPSDTGRLYGMLCPLRHAIGSERLEIDVTPDFAGAGFEGDAELALSLVPARLAWPTLRFAARIMVAPS